MLPVRRARWASGVRKKAPTSAPAPEDARRNPSMSAPPPRTSDTTAGKMMMLEMPKNVTMTLNASRSCALVSLAEEHEAFAEFLERASRRRPTELIPADCQEARDDREERDAVDPESGRDAEIADPPAGEGRPDHPAHLEDRRVQDDRLSDP